MENINTVLTAEEVNIYSMDCGDIKLHCVVDCIDGSAWITPAQ